MRTTLVGTGVLGMMLSLAMGGCVVGESPVVGDDTGGSGGSGGSGAGGSGTSPGTGGSAATTGGGDPGDLTGSTTFWMGELRPPSEPEATDACLPWPLPVEPEGNSGCRLYTVALGRDTNGSCACLPGTQPASADATRSLNAYLAQQSECGLESGPACSEFCACEVPEAEGADRTSCLNDREPTEGAVGWCYLAPDAGIGDPSLVADCPDAFRQRLRYLDTGGGPDDFYVIACAGSEGVPPGLEVDPKPLGDPCVPDDERRPDFNGFQGSDVSVDTNAGCDSGVCLVNHFQGRVSCPYGQTLVDAENDRKCFVPGTGIGVTVPVDPQYVERREARAAVCSCRCAGDGPGPFCTCPSDMECSPVIDKLGLSTDESFAGSYCIPRGSAYDPTHHNAEPCNRDYDNCGDVDPN